MCDWRILMVGKKRLNPNCDLFLFCLSIDFYGSAMIASRSWKTQSPYLSCSLPFFPSPLFLSSSLIKTSFRDYCLGIKLHLMHSNLNTILRFKWYLQLLSLDDSKWVGKTLEMDSLVFTYSCLMVHLNFSFRMDSTTAVETRKCDTQLVHHNYSLNKGAHQKIQLRSNVFLKSHLKT